MTQIILALVYTFAIKYHYFYQDTFLSSSNLSLAVVTANNLEMWS